MSGSRETSSDRSCSESDLKLSKIKYGLEFLDKLRQDSFRSDSEQLRSLDVSLEPDI